MALYAFIAPPLAGHYGPMAALAGGLIDRGHRAVFVDVPGAETLLTDPRIGFMALPGAVAGTLEQTTARLVGQGGLRHLPALLADMRARFAAFSAGLPDALARIGAQCLVVDQLEPAAGLVAHHLGLPCLTVACALPIDADPTLPPPFTGWSWRTGALARLRNRGGWWVQNRLLAGLNADIARQSAGWGQRADGMVACQSPVAIAQTVAGFDFPRSTQALLPLGPLRAPPRAARPLTPPPGSGPLIFASLGTLQGGRADVFAAIAQAVRRLGGRLIIAHGGRLANAHIAALPGQTLAVDFVDQTALLPHVDAVISHGGLNTTMDSLAAGRPLIIVPFAFEQAAIGARLVRSGAGLVVAPGPRLAQRLIEPLTGLLGLPEYRVAAARLATEIAGAGGLARAVAIADALPTSRHAEAA